MPTRLPLPDEVKDAIRRRITEALDQASGGYQSAAEDEDTLTGDLCGALRTKPQRVFVQRSVVEVPGQWTWSIDYRRFRGRGPGAEEKAIGADGIFQLTVDFGSHAETKSLLFQAKIAGKSEGRMREQVLRLSTWREAAFILLHTPTGPIAVGLDDAISDDEALDASSGIPLHEYLGKSYLECLVGDVTLRWETSPRKRLVWRAMNGQMVGMDFGLKHRTRINVRAPRTGRGTDGIDRILSEGELPNFRMRAEEAEILGVPMDAADATVKQAYKELAAAYHPDRFSELGDLAKAFATRRTQEAVAARQRFKKR